MINYDARRKSLTINLQGNDSEVTLRPKECGVWELLLRHRDEAVSRQLLCDEVWQGRYVADFTINQTINQLRKKIGDSSKKIIVTVPRKGYALNSSYIRDRSGVDNGNTAMTNHCQSEATVKTLQIPVSDRRNIAGECGGGENKKVSLMAKLMRLLRRKEN